MQTDHIETLAGNRGGILLQFRLGHHIRKALHGEEADLFSRLFLKRQLSRAVDNHSAERTGGTAVDDPAEVQRGTGRYIEFGLRKRAPSGRNFRLRNGKIFPRKHVQGNRTEQKFVSGLRIQQGITGNIRIVSGHRFRDPEAPHDFLPFSAHRKGCGIRIADRLIAGKIFRVQSQPHGASGRPLRPEFEFSALHSADFFRRNVVAELRRPREVGGTVTDADFKRTLPVRSPLRFSGPPDGDSVVRIRWIFQKIFLRSGEENG